MKKASEYRKHAEECRTLSRQMKGAQREQTLDLATTWDNLAEDRSVLVRRHPEIGLEGEHREEMSRAKEDESVPMNQEPQSPGRTR